MNPTNLLQKLAPVGVAAFGAISVIGIATVPAQAGQLGWDDGTSDFFDAVVNSDGNPTGADFSVIFSPEFLGGQAAVFSATDQFAPFFDPPELADVEPITVNFGNYVPIDPIPGVPVTEFEYTLLDPLTFAFASGPVVTIGEGTTFLGEIDIDDLGNPLGVEFELEVANSLTTSVVVGGQTYTLGDPHFPITGEAFEFEDIASIGGGEYAGLVSVEDIKNVPEPTTILGLLTISGLGLGLKRKKHA